jgi:very-short-patch-repair endonuclease
MSRVTRGISPHARPLRAEQTDVERAFWHAVRDRRLGGYKFRRQFTVGHYIADFACLEARLIVELDGAQHGDAISYDDARTHFLETQGYKVMRFWNGTVRENMAGVLYSVRWELDVQTGRVPEDAQR